MKVSMNNFEYPYEKYYSQIATTLYEIKEVITGKAIDKNIVILASKNYVNNLIQFAERILNIFKGIDVTANDKLVEAINTLSQAIEKCREERKI